MKKLVVLSLLCLCVSPSYAQKDFWRGLTHWKKPAAFETNIKSAVSRTEAALKLLGSPHIQITNLPGEPLVKLGGAVDNAPAILSARMLSKQESYKTIWPEQGFSSPIYIPTTLNSEEEVMYRGMRLYQLTSVKYILEHGIKYTHVSKAMHDKIFFSGWVYRAADFATYASMEQEFLPTIIKFTVPPYRDNIYKRIDVWGFDYFYWGQDIPASNIQDVMVLFEVNGTPGWYKVTLENGELVFTPAPSRVFKKEEIIEHKLDIPKENTVVY